MKLDLLLSNQRKDLRIACHVVFWICIETFYTIMYGASSGKYFMVFRDLLFTLPLDMAITYFHIYFLIPRFLLKKRYALFFSLFSLTAIVSVVIETAVNIYIVADIFYKGLRMWDIPFFSYRMFYLFLYIYSIVALASAIKMLKYWYNSEQQKIKLEIQNKASELALLRSQINPHFLFNTLNNIDALIRIDQKEASNSVHKLSDIMRYMLYEAVLENVPLEREIGYLRTLIDLQKLRVSKKDYISFEVEGDTDHYQIAPMLLVPFIENAFKHCDKQATGPCIVIKIKLMDETLYFEVNNSIRQGGHEHKDSTSGIGLVNVKRRLELLYPGRHILNIDETDGRFRVNLLIRLT